MKKFLMAIAAISIVTGCAQKSNEISSKSVSPTTVQQLIKKTPDNDCGIFGIKILEPAPTTIVSFPIIVTAEVNNRDVPENCRWTVFEAQAGSVTLADSSGTVISTGVLKTLDDWMTDGPVVYKASLNLANGPKTKDLMVTINEEKPSGDIGQKLEFEIKLP